MDMLFKNKLEKLLKNDAYNLRHKGEKYSGMLYSMYDVPGKLYKTVYLGKTWTVSGDITEWLLLTKIEGPGIQPYVDIRLAILSRDDSCWYTYQDTLARVYNSNDMNNFIETYKNNFRAEGKVKKFR